MYNWFYALTCIVLANLVYKSNSSKRRIVLQPTYAIFVGLWMCLFAVLLFIPSIPLMNIKYAYLPIFLTVTFLWYSFPKIVRTYGSDPTELNKDYSPSYLLHFTQTIVFAKYFEILWQQGLFIYVLFVVLYGQTEFMKIVLFFILNIILHLANILFIKKKDTMFFVYWSIPMGIIFGYLLLHGYIFLTASIHMLFYLIVNGSLWLKKT